MGFVGDNNECQIIFPHTEACNSASSTFANLQDSIGSWADGGNCGLRTGVRANVIVGSDSDDDGRPYECWVKPQPSFGRLVADGRWLLAGHHSTECPEGWTLTLDADACREA